MNILLYLFVVSIMALSNWYSYNKGREHQRLLDNMYNPNNIKKEKYEKRDKESNRFCQ